MNRLIQKEKIERNLKENYYFRQSLAHFVQRKMDEVVANLKAVLLASKGGIALNRINSKLNVNFSKLLKTKKLTKKLTKLTKKKSINFDLKNFH